MGKCLVILVLWATPHWPDARQLRALADSANPPLPVVVVLAIAWQESGGNLNPLLRGHHCWHGGYVLANGDTVVARHDRDCEVGRFQIKPSTARSKCPEFDVFTYRGNLACFAKVFGEDYRANGVDAAIEHWNAGPKGQSKGYLHDVLFTVGWLTTREG